MEYEHGPGDDGDIAERLEVIATNLYYQNKIIGEKLGNIISNLEDIADNLDIVTVKQLKEQNNE